MRRVLIAVLIVLAACGSHDARITVFAAASLTEAFRQLSSPAAYNFAGSQALARQIEQGAPADVFASADEKNMQRLVDARLVEAPRVFAHNRLEIVVATGNPKHVAALADLARPDVLVVLADPSVPAGNYAQQALQNAGVTVQARSLELDVKAALAKVTSGEADATIVYVTDVKAAGARAEGVAIPEEYNQLASYPIAVVKATRHRAAARAFVDEVVKGAGQRALRAHGFLPA